MLRSTSFAMLGFAAAVAAASCVLDRSGQAPDGAGGAGASASTSGPTSSSGLTTSGSTTSSSGTTTSSSGATTSSSSGAGGGATSSSASSSSSSGMVMEDCTNGVDDNGDGKIDCDDPQCKTFVEVPSVPLPYGGLDLGQCANPMNGSTCGACSACTPDTGMCTMSIALFKDDKCKMQVYSKTGPGCDNGVNAMSMMNLHYIAQNVDDMNMPATCMPGSALVDKTHAFCPGQKSVPYKQGMAVCQPPEATCVQVQAKDPCPPGFGKRTQLDTTNMCKCGCHATEDCPGMTGNYDSTGNCGMVNQVFTADGKCQDSGIKGIGSVKLPSEQAGTNAKCKDIDPGDIAICCP